MTIANLAAALVSAQSAAQAVSKSSTNTFARYKYASAEALIAEGREALSGAGLALMTISWEVAPPAIVAPPETTQPASSRVKVRYMLLHSSGEQLEITTETSVVPEKGRPADKAEATALTYNLGYLIRGLLLLPREDESASVDQRRDGAAPAAPKPAAAAPARAPAAPAAPITAATAPVTDGLTAPGPAKPAAPTPPTDGGLKTIAEFLDAVAKAQSVDVLQLIAKRAVAVQLSKEDNERLRPAWAARKSELSSVAA